MNTRVFSLVFYDDSFYGVHKFLDIHHHQTLYCYYVPSFVNSLFTSGFVHKWRLIFRGIWFCVIMSYKRKFFCMEILLQREFKNEVFWTSFMNDHFFVILFFYFYLLAKWFFNTRNSLLISWVWVFLKKVKWRRS